MNTTKTYPALQLLQDGITGSSHVVYGCVSFRLLIAHKPAEQRSHTANMNLVVGLANKPGKPLSACSCTVDVSHVWSPLSACLNNVEAIQGAKIGAKKVYFWKANNNSPSKNESYLDVNKNHRLTGLLEAFYLECEQGNCRSAAVMLHLSFLNLKHTASEKSIAYLWESEMRPQALKALKASVQCDEIDEQDKLCTELANEHLGEILEAVANIGNAYTARLKAYPLEVVNG